MTAGAPQPGIRITVYAGEGPDDGGLHKPSVVSYFTSASEVHETLRQLGLEWKQADYFPARQVVITLDPIASPNQEDNVREKVRAAAEALEDTGLL